MGFVVSISCDLHIIITSAYIQGFLRDLELLVGEAYG